MPILTLDLKLPSEFAKTATVGTSADWLVIEKSGEAEVSKIAAVPAAVGAAPAGGDLAVAWSAANVRSSTGYLYQQAENSGLVGSISLYNTGVLNRMVFRNDSGFQFYELEGTVLAPVYAGDYSGDGYYLTNDPNTGVYSGGADVLAFMTGGSGRAYFGSTGHFQPGADSTYDLGSTSNRWRYLYSDNLNTGTISPEADSTYTIGVTGNRYYRGWFDELYTGPLQSGTILPIADETYNLGSAALAWNTIYYQTATDVSDKTLKTDIADGDLGLDFIDSLRPVKFRWRVGGGVDTGEKDADGQPVMTPRPGVRFHYGLVADEVKAAMGERDFGGYVEDAESGRKGLRYSQIVSVLIKAMQELHGQVKELSARLEAAEAKLAAITPAVRSRA